MLLLLGYFSALSSRSARFSHFSLTDSQSRRKLQNLSLIDQIEGVRLINCALKCLRHTSCVSFTHKQSLLCSLGGSSHDMTSGEGYVIGSFDSLRDMHCFQGNFPFSPRKSFVFSLAYPSRNRMLILQDLARILQDLARLTSACKNLARLTSVLQDSCKINIQNLQDSCKINIQTPLKKSQKKRLKNLKDVKKSAK